MKLQTGDAAKNERKERILAYYNYAGDTVKSAMYMGYHDATDRSDWIQTFQIPIVTPEHILPDDDRYIGDVLNIWKLEHNPASPDHCPEWFKFLDGCNIRVPAGMAAAAEEVMDKFLCALMQPSAFRMLERTTVFLKKQIDAHLAAEAEKQQKEATLAAEAEKQQKEATKALAVVPAKRKGKVPKETDDTRASVKRKWSPDEEPANVENIDWRVKWSLDDCDTDAFRTWKVDQRNPINRLGRRLVREFNNHIPLCETQFTTHNGRHYSADKLEDWCHQKNHHKVYDGRAVAMMVWFDHMPHVELQPGEVSVCPRALLVYGYPYVEGYPDEIEGLGSWKQHWKARNSCSSPHPVIWRD